MNAFPTDLSTAAEKARSVRLEPETKGYFNILIPATSTFLVLYSSPDSVIPRAGTLKRLQSSSPRCPARDQLTAGILHTHNPSLLAARHPHPGPWRIRQARTSPASYLPWLSARPCWPRCFPAPLTVGGQRGSLPAGLSAAGGAAAAAAAARAAAAAAGAGSRERAARLAYRIIPALIPRSFPPLRRGAAAAASSSLCVPPPPSLNTFPPTPHPPRFSVTPFSTPPAPSDALMPRMLLPPLRPSRGCGTSRLGRPHCAGARRAAPPVSALTGPGLLGLGVLRTRGAGARLARGCRSPRPAPGLSPRVKAGAARGG